MGDRLSDLEIYGSYVPNVVTIHRTPTRWCVSEHERWRSDLGIMSSRRRRRYVDSEYEAQILMIRWRDEIPPRTTGLSHG